MVVSAWHIDLQQKVAIKFLHPLLAEREDAVERFLHEARAVVRIESEHVARVLDVGRLEGATPYLVMEFLEGEDLAATLRKRGPFPVQEAVTYLQQACEALAEAHAAGIVHRDLKPANLFLVERGTEARRIKVLDFGISKTTTATDQAKLTSTSVIMGSPIYMSPEQLRSTRDVDDKTDIWALGVILYEMLTGREPFVAQTLPQLCAMILESEPLPPSSLRDEIPLELEHVVLRCLEKSPIARYESVAELSQALVPFGPEDAATSAERAARALGRTGSAFKSRLTPSTATLAAVPQGSGARKSLAVLVLLLGVASLVVLLLRVFGSGSPASAARSLPGPSGATSSMPAAASAIPVASSVAVPEPTASGASDREKLPRTPPSPRRGPATAPKGASSRPRSTVSRPALDRPTVLPRSGFDPPADNFGGRK